MPFHTRLPFDLDENNWVLLRAATQGFEAASVRRTRYPTATQRQSHFERMLRQISGHLQSDQVPVFIHTPTRGPVRLDAGCVGHAVANRVIEPLEDSPTGIVEWLTLTR